MYIQDSLASFSLESIKLSNASSFGTSTTDYYIGLGLAISSSIFIGSSFILKKRALVRLADRGTRAGDGGVGYLTDWVWWGGMLLLALGEIANFIAYAFAPATLVTPLGALSVLVTAILSSRFLQQHLNLPGKVGCFVCISGSTMIVLHAPKEQVITSMEELFQKLQDPVFMCYAAIIVIMNTVLIFYVSPRHGHQNPLVYVTISGSIGSLSVMWCKAVGVAIRDSLFDPVHHNEFKNWLTYVILLLLTICLLVQMNYLNKALDIFHTGVVTPLLYVCFTTFTLTASTILFKEWRNLGALDILGILTGFFTILAAIFLLQALKDIDIQFLHLRVPLHHDQSDSQDLSSSLWSRGSTHNYSSTNNLVPYVEQTGSNESLARLLHVDEESSHTTISPGYQLTNNKKVRKAKPFSSSDATKLLLATDESGNEGTSHAAALSPNM